MPSTPPQSNSLLNMLNPYSSVSRSAYPFPREPDSPSTMLLRELQGDDDDTGAAPAARPERTAARRDMSPTPRSGGRIPVERKSSGRNAGFATVSSGPLAKQIHDEIDEVDGPSRSILFGSTAQEAPGGDRTPRSPPTPLPIHRPMVISTDHTPDPFVGLTPQPPSSPGPFQPPSSSASDNQSRSRSTSPGPSSLSVYASGLEGNEGGTSSVPCSSRAESTSPESGPSRVVRGPRVPTFREPPADRSRAPTAEHISSANRPKSTTGVRAGYLDPPIDGSGDRKGKGKAKNQGGRRYHAVSAHEDEIDRLEVDEGRGEDGESGNRRKVGLNAYERALWRWVNIEDLDGFLQEVYAYYKGKGLWCIILARFLNLITTFFVIGFSTFLFSCIDYSKLNSELSGPHGVGKLDDVLVGQCLTRGSLPHMLFIISVGVVYVFQLATFLLSIPRLLDMYRFYTHLLGIPDADIQTLPWPEIVHLIGEIRKHNPITSLSNQNGPLAEMVGDDGMKGAVKKLDAHDVANRILRQENYLIALFNKDLLDLRVRFPVPHPLVPYVPPRLLAPSVHTALPSQGGNKRERRFISFGKNTLTTALEWNLRFCLMGFLFDRRGQVRKEFVRERRRKDLVEGLKRRFVFMGVLNAIFAPFIVFYLLIYSFFRYFEEYHKNPSSIGSRAYTPYAQWKFREFNELPHLFERRLDRSYITAKEYIDQFPKERTALVMRFVAFVAGSFAAVLLVASLIDPDLFLHFEITPHRTVLFYLGLFGGVLAVARGMVPDENLVFDPEASLREVVKWTHYLPGEWRGKLHSQMEFGTLFAMKIMIFFQELLSVLLTPLILFFSLPPCAGALIDFFREFTVHVEGVGYVCSFAVFDFRRHGNLGAGAGDGLAPLKSPEIDGPPNRILAATGPVPAKSNAKPTQSAAGADRDWSRANENKMEKSFLHFKATHPDWVPDPSSSMFLDKLVGMHRQQMQYHAGEGGMTGSIYAGGRGLGIGTGGGSLYQSRFQLDGPAYAVGVQQNAQNARGLRSRAWVMDEKRLQERSRSYDRAWAKSSHLLNSHPARSAIPHGKPSPGFSEGGHARDASPAHGRGRGLETMAEQNEDGPPGSGRREGEGEDEERREVHEEGYETGVGTHDASRDRGWRAGGDGVPDDGILGEEEGDGDIDEEGRGFLRDVGVVGILQQIMGR